MPLDRTDDDPTRYGNPPGLGFWALVHEDYRTHGGDWTSPGFRALLVHRFGNWRMGIRSRALRVPLSVVYRMLFRRVRDRYGIELDFSTRVGRRVVIDIIEHDLIDLSISARYHGLAAEGGSAAPSGLTDDEADEAEFAEEG